MTSRDARTISPNTQFEIRRQAVRLQQGGYKISTIAKLLEVDRNTVGKWLRKFKEGGFESLKPKKRDRKNGTKMQLSQKIQDTVRKLLIEKHPDQLKLNFALWSREAVGLLIKEHSGLELDLRQVGRYLNRWGFTPQRPIKRAYQRDDKKVKEWMEETYPSIKKRAKSEGAEIHWADEVGIKSHDHRGRGYSPRGKTPVRMHNPSYEKVNMISSVTNQGTLQFMCYDGSFNYRIFHEFLKQLIKSSRGRKVFVIVDNLRVHHSKIIKRWLRRYSNYIEVEYLPSYCPDLNPDEYLNCDLKIQLAKRPERRTKGEWKNTVDSTIESFQKQPKRIASYFQANLTEYAA